MMTLHRPTVAEQVAVLDAADVTPERGSLAFGAANVKPIPQP